VLSRIDLTDFKAFHQLGLDFAPITVLLGPNNSGKSSIIAPIRLLAQTAQSGDPTVPLLLDGPMGDFGTFRDVVHGNHRGRPMRIKATVIDSTTDEDTEVTIDIEVKYRPQRRELVVRETSLALDGRLLVTAALSSDAQRHVITHIAGRVVPAAQRSALSDYLRMRQFVPRVYIYGRRRAPQGAEARRWHALVQELEDDAELATWTLDRALSRVDYLSAMRQAPERTYHQTGAASTRVGQTGDNWAGLFVLDSARTPKQRTIGGLPVWMWSG
jgi:hypothetical protein